MKSVWQQTRLPEFKPLTQDTDTEVLVIGGGLTGLLCAKLLTESGVDVLLLEADTLCSGTTGRTTAKITALHGLRCTRLIRSLGIEAARMYYRANLEAVDRYANMCTDIDCDFARQDAFVYSRDNRGIIDDEAAALRSIGVDADCTDCTELPFGAYAVRMKNQAQFNPLAFAAGICRRLNIREHTPVRAIHGHTAVTDGGSVRAEKIVIATHFPFINRHGSYYLKLYQERSYVLALEGVPKFEGMYLDADPDGLSLRMHGDMLLLGGGGGRTGSCCAGWDHLTSAAGQMFPDSTEKFRWAAQDCMSLDGMPYIGRYSAMTTDWYVATGFNKWGMTSAMTAAELLAAELTGRKKAWSALFSPSRSMLRRQLAVNAAHAVGSVLTPARPRCPHMGCALVWNKAERTWDCPCHGSRFAEDGKLIESPSQKGLRTTTENPRSD